MFLNLSETPQQTSVTLIHKLYFELKILIGEGTTFKSISKIIRQYWNCRIQYLRVFTPLGCELVEDDLKYLNNDEKIFVSLAGETFDVKNIYSDYLILKRLQRGVIAVHEATQNQVVIKHSQIEIDNANSLDNILSWLQEIKYNKQLNIENCRLIDDNLIQIRKFQNGKSFESISKKPKPLSESKAQNYFLQIAQILINHRHRNQSLSNIILDNVIHLVDFNYKNNSDLHTTPEQIINNEVNGSGQDVWSFGVILYRMIYGVYPFGNIDYEQLTNNVQFCQYQSTTPKMKVSKELTNLFSKIFIISPLRRITMDSILNHPFFYKDQELQYTEIEINENLFFQIKPRVQLDLVILMRRKLQQMTTITVRNRQPSRQRAKSVFYC